MAVLREKHHQQQQQQKRKHVSSSFFRHSVDSPHHQHSSTNDKSQTDDAEQQARNSWKHLSQRRSRNQVLVLSLPLLLVLLLHCSHVQGAPTPGVQSSNAVGPNSAAGSGEVALPMKDPNWLKGYEPSCDELRQMWRFSKRQSRAAEITNEIPTYRGDPFAINMWQPSKPRLSNENLMKGRAPARYMYDRSGNAMRNSARNRGGFGFPQFSGRAPIYGRVLHKEPEDIEFGIPVSQQSQRRVQYRFPGPSPVNYSPTTTARMTGGNPPPMNTTPQRGRFLELKELVWTERAKELANQRRNEEMLARAAVLKELANGGHGLSSYQNAGSGQFNNQDSYFNGGMDYNGETGRGGMGSEEESAFYDGSSMGGGAGPKLSHFRERNSFLQQQQQQQPASNGNGNSKINFPSKHSRLY